MSDIGTASTNNEHGIMQDEDFSKIIRAIVTENPYEFRLGSWTDMPLNRDPFLRFRELVRSHVLLKRPDATADEIALVQRLAISRSNPFEPAYMRELPAEQMWAAELVYKMMTDGPPIPLAEK